MGEATVTPLKERERKGRAESLCVCARAGGRALGGGGMDPEGRKQDENQSRSSYVRRSEKGKTVQA